MFEILIFCSVVVIYFSIGFYLGKCVSEHDSGFARRMERVFWFFLWPLAFVLVVLVSPFFKEKL